MSAILLAGAAIVSGATMMSPITNTPAPELAIASDQLAYGSSPANEVNADTQSDAIVVEARRKSPPGDPMVRINEKSFVATQAADRAVVGPIALGYRNAVPAPVRDGFRNLLDNLREPVVALNFLLQCKPGKASATLGRLAINSTLGIAGLFDIAKRHPFRIRHRPNGFADTLGFYGVGPGPYLFLPLTGPTTVRDLLGGGIDRMLLPLTIGKPFNRGGYTLSTGAVNALNHRVAIDGELHRLRDTSPDPYDALRRAYLERRQAEIDALRHPNMH